MDNPTLNRFEWAKMVLQAEGLTPTAKTVASALAIQFANDETGQLNPSQETLADYLKVHRDTVKRVLRELRNAGWLMAVGDGGRGKAPLLRLLTPGKILPFRPAKQERNRPVKGRANHPAQAEKRGGNMCEKGGQIVTPHYKDKQSLEQKARATPTRPAPASQYLVRRGSPAEAHWNRWLAGNGFPNLASLDQRLQDGWNVPATLPPDDPKGIDWMIAEKWARWATWRREDRRRA